MYNNLEKKKINKFFFLFRSSRFTEFRCTAWQLRNNVSSPIRAQFRFQNNVNLFHVYFCLFIDADVYCCIV
jgi:hypothetical protein